MAIAPRDTVPNRQRQRAILLSREFKWVFGAVPGRFTRLAARPFVGLLWRWLFLSPDGELNRSAEYVLGELKRSTGFYRKSVFDPDPLVMAYREGRRSVTLEIASYLNLDEMDVRNTMELDDE